MKLNEYVMKEFGKSVIECTNEELYVALLHMTKDMAQEKASNEGKKKLYYI